MKNFADQIILIISFVALSGLIWLIYFHSAPADVLNQGDKLLWVKYLPAVNASLNASAAFCLIFGYFAIKKKKQSLHIKFMVSAFTFSAMFLCSYIVYHYFHGDTKFQGVGTIRYFYFFILITHIVLSGISLPMILRTFYLALTKDWSAHKKMARWTFPCWLYVSITGVVIYFFLKLTY